MKIILTPWILSFIAMFGLSGLFFTIIVSGFISENIVPEILKTPPNLILISSGYLLLALLMTLLYPKLVTSENYSIKSGFLFGLFLSVLWLLPLSLVLHGAYNFPTIGLLIDSSWAVIEQGIGGIIIGYSYKKLSAI